MITRMLKTLLIAGALMLSGCYDSSILDAERREHMITSPTTAVAIIQQAPELVPSSIERITLKCIFPQYSRFGNSNNQYKILVEYQTIFGIYSFIQEVKGCRTMGIFSEIKIIERDKVEVSLLYDLEANTIVPYIKQAIFHNQEQKKSL